MCKRTADAIELPDDERIAGPGDLKGFVQTWALDGTSGAHVIINLLATGPFKGVALQIEILFAGRNPHIANQHDLSPSY